MINKIYEKIKKIIKEDYKIIIIYAFIFFVLTHHLPYFISSPGGLIDTSKKINTNENFRLKGSLNMAYVTEMHATIPTYIWSFVAKDWDLEKEKDVISSGETIKDMDYRNKMLLNESNKIAELVAYKNSNIEYELKHEKIYVTYIDKAAKTNLKIKDRIIKIDGHKIPNKNFLLTYITSKNIGDKIKLTVLNNEKEIEKQATLINVNNEPKIGVLITESFQIESNRKIKFNFKNAESGPSGGLMIALTIYSNLNKIDLTQGRKIAGTGTIDINGNVGEISGVKYKLIGAVKEKADIFLVPEDNYKEAKKIKKEKGYSIDIIPVETFEEAIRYLEK
ncbi:MAG: PDZ domain-containing protein [Bacilli bacterium]|nr:PDZ domain-containing protein [Bacilli bacterium]